MRTTLDINDELYVQAKDVAVRTGRSMKEVVEDALRIVFRQQQQQPRKRITLPVSRSAPGLMPGVNLDSSAEMLHLMESDDADRRR